MKKITFNANNFDPDTRWVNPGHVMAAVLVIAYIALIIVALA